MDAADTRRRSAETEEAKARARGGACLSRQSQENADIVISANAASTASGQCRLAFAAVAVTSVLVNILYLTSPFFMLQVYDRIIPSKSIPSLIALGLLASTLFLFQAAFELIRARLLVRISALFDESISETVFKASLSASLRGPQGSGPTVLADFEKLRHFLSSSGPAAFFDLPWLPFYLFICFLCHPVVGIVSLCGALVLTLLASLANRNAKGFSKQRVEFATDRHAWAAAAQQNAGLVHVMGMADDLASGWTRRSDPYRRAYARYADGTNLYATLSKIFRIALQSSVLAAGAVLVIEGKASGGVILASSILTSRALAPVELAIMNWRSFTEARFAWRRLKRVLKQTSARQHTLSLPKPHRDLVVEALSSGPGLGGRTIVSEIAFSLTAGTVLGIVGPSASGKTALVRTLVGIWPVRSGSIRLDGAEPDQWDPVVLGRSVGYLPQEVELFAGTVAENIARFRAGASSESVITATKSAGAHEMILKLADGYETEIGNGGAALSAGQRQRIALARALYGDPFLVVLDEPNSNLDGEGEAALVVALAGVRARGGIAIVATHRPSALAQADLVLVMASGKMTGFGPKDAVLKRLLRQDDLQVTVGRQVLHVVGETRRVDGP